jgi:hypothetical protein
MKAGRESCYGVLPAYALHLEGVVQNSICHPVPLPLSMTARPVHSRSQSLLQHTFCSCQRGSGEIGGSRPAHDNQDFPTSSHVQLSGPRGIILEAELEEVLLVRSSDAVLVWQKRNGLYPFQEQEAAAGLVKGSPRTAVLLAFLQQLQ